MECQKNIRIDLTGEAEAETESENKTEIPTLSGSVDARERVCGTNSKVFSPRKEKKHNKKFTFKQKVALMMLGAADFMSFCSMSIMAPFYPKEAASKGMTESMAGYIFGFYALVVFISCPVFGKILPKLGVKFSFIGGLLVSGVCSVIFGMLHTVQDYTLFTTLSFTIRGFGALGAGIYSTAAYVIIINIFPDNAGAVRGLLETFVGLGMSAGPGIGGILFAVSINFLLMSLKTILQQYRSRPICFEVD
ncbi:MFS-type transporter SLC18B1-like, partial [Anoplophora glabripennis]|uniref:MFS-type transporter SLC18B1-like n=1 Tax=Anoplophora glabripennis TaxID=217634 RepID=UPI0008755B66